MALRELWERPTPSAEPDQPGVNTRGEATQRILETLYQRADPVSTTASPPLTTPTPYAVSLTTKFIPPESCSQNQLTMLSSPGYFIWLHEPVPVPGTTVSDCYPSEFMDWYTTYQVNPGSVGSLVPLMSPLVCPSGWQVATEQGSYQACCPVGYGLTPPQTTADPNRPAYGGTCYSEWPLSSSAYVRVFDSVSASGSTLVIASTSPFANYAHPIDGIAVPMASSTSASQTPTGSIQPGGYEHASLASGAIAGIVVGVLVTVSLSAAGLYLFIRRRRGHLNLIPKNEATSATVNSPAGIENSFHDTIEIAATPTTGKPHTYELEAGHLPHEKP
ncbi:hypothetical protein F4777DRAFT_526884 [Nemania sp. FL0916]|nr:hypothetical protein F4777DRAFT_526884 [Nemania sp. FL0916]